MLLTTQSGILVNLRHVTHVALRQHEPEPMAPPSEEKRKLHKVLLSLTTGDCVVAADRLERDTAVFLRKDIAHHWAEGSALFDVVASLEAHRNGAYYASGATDATEGGT